MTKNTLVEGSKECCKITTITNELRKFTTKGKMNRFQEIKNLKRIKINQKMRIVENFGNGKF